MAGGSFDVWWGQLAKLGGYKHLRLLKASAGK